MSREDLKNAVLLRAARNVFNLSLQKVAEQIDVSSTAVGKWENCDALPKKSTFSALQKFYKANGVVINLEDGEAVIRIKSEAIDCLEANPKKPVVKTLQEIHQEEMIRKPQNLADIEALVTKEVQEELEHDPEFVNKLLKGVAAGGLGGAAFATMGPTGLLLGGLLATASFARSHQKDLTNKESTDHSKSEEDSSTNATHSDVVQSKHNKEKSDE